MTKYCKISNQLLKLGQDQLREALLGFRVEAETVSEAVGDLVGVVTFQDL